MTAEEFNKKYREYLEKGFDGLMVDHPSFTKYLDSKFQDFIKRPGFNYAQIKLKFNTLRFYAKEVTFEEQQEIEQKYEKYKEKT